MKIITNQYWPKFLLKKTINIKKLSIEQNLDMIKPYLSDLINENKGVESSPN